MQHESPCKNTINYLFCSHKFGMQNSTELFHDRSKIFNQQVFKKVFNKYYVTLIYCKHLCNGFKDIVLCMLKEK